MTVDLVKAVKVRLTGVAPIASGRSNKTGRVSFDDLVFIPAQLATQPVDYFVEKIDASTMVGKMSKYPLRLETPILIAAMSFGAVSRETKIALAKASALAGTAANTGEGGALPEERAEARLLVAQYSTGRFGVTEAYLKAADAIEIKIGQGAKPGQGGLLPAKKLTPEIAAIRGVPLGKDVHSPARHMDIKSIADLRRRVNELREIAQGKPIFIKLGAGRVEEDVRLAVEAEPDVIAIDGMEGGTGAAPEIMLHDFGTPTLAALVRARRALDEIGAKQDLIIGGGLDTGIDVAKALALGADAVFMATALLVAMGCTRCGLCHLDVCPVGIATQRPELRTRFNIDEAAQAAANFLRACTEEVKMAAGAVGKDNIHKLNRDDLRAITLLAAEVTGLPIV